VTLRISLGCALLAILLGACQQTLVLDDFAPDAGRTGKGGTTGGGSGGRSDGGPGDASSDARCNGSQLFYNPDVAQILVAIDKSSTMGASLGGVSRFQAALNAVQSDVSRYNGHNGRASIQFAFLDFPDSAPDCNAANGCCPSDVTTSYSDFQNANICNSTGPNGCFELTTRPTAAALDEAITYFSSLGGSVVHGGERFVLLITDDDPQGTCPSNNDMDACSAAIAKVGTLSSGNLGVTTEVVAIGSSTPCLTELANSQGGVFPAPYYLASMPNDLPTIVDQIVSSAAQNACRLTLTSPPPSGQVTVYWGNTLELQDNGTTGNTWNYGGDDTRIVLHGSLCTNFLQGNPNGPNQQLQIYDSCPSRTGLFP